MSARKSPQRDDLRESPMTPLWPRREKSREEPSAPPEACPCQRIHEALERLPRYTNAGEVPFNDGLYFFYEEGQVSAHSPRGRIVRVGNHPRSDGTLKRRLATHLKGQKNASVFRKLVGGALMRRNDPSNPCLAPAPGAGHWEQQNGDVCNRCRPLEEKVTEYFRHSFSFRCLPINGREERNRLEDALIATLARCPDCGPTVAWLGLHAYPQKVHDSGLWNVLAVDGEPLTGAELDRVLEIAADTARKASVPAEPMTAPQPAPAQTEENAPLAEYDPAHTLIVISCSKAKSWPRGITDEQVQVIDGLPAELVSRLAEARGRLRYVAEVDDAVRDPAWCLYDGIAYRAAAPALGEAVRQGAHILILSGGYGVVHAKEQIGRYERVFDARDWSDGLIGEVLTAYADLHGLTSYVGLVSGSTGYAEALRRAWSSGTRPAAVLSPVDAKGTQQSLQTTGQALATLLTDGQLPAGWRSSHGLTVRNSLEEITPAAPRAESPASRGETRGDWGSINERIRQCWGSGDPEACLRRLLDDTGDPWVHANLGRAVARRDPVVGLQSLVAAHARLPLPRWKTVVAGWIDEIEAPAEANVPSSDEAAESEPAASAADPTDTSALPQFDLERAHTAMKAAFGDRIAGLKIEGPKDPEYANALDDDSRIPSGLLARSLGEGRSLWTHQAKAIDAALDGKNVVIETETASGKSLCYLIPILSKLARDPDATAIYLAPLNALVDDQLRSIRERFGNAGDGSDPMHAYTAEITIDGRTLLVARVDGDVPDPIRLAIRARRPQFIITNPDMLHWSVLSHHRMTWSWMYRNLAFVVLDEMHMYRGLFGANVANLLRRLRRIAGFHRERAFGPNSGSRTQFIGCSASIAEPGDHFSALTGRRPDVTVEAADSGAPRSARLTVLLDGVGERSLAELATDVLALLTAEHAQAIAFMRSIAEVNRTQRLAQECPAPLGGSAVRQYKREVPANEKREVIAGLRTGAVRAVISTNALEVGIDVGELNAVVICKLPGSLASLRQQVGRAGRQQDSIAVLIADESPADRFYASRPEMILGGTRLQAVYLNQDHPEVLAAHLECAAGELPLDRDRIYAGEPEPFASAAGVDGVVSRLRTDGVLRVASQGLEAVAELSDRLRRVKMRGTNADCLIHDADNPSVEVAKPDIGRVQRHFHVGARFQIQDRVYEVVRLEVERDWSGGQAWARQVDSKGYSTSTPAVTVVNPVGAVAEHTAKAGIVFGRGNVEITSVVEKTWRVWPSNTGRRPEVVQLETSPPAREWTTEGLWLDVPVQSIEGGLDRGAVNSLAGALRVGAAMACSTEREDLITSVGEPGTLGNPHWRIYLADINPGGDGLTRMAFRQIDTVIKNAAELLVGCPHCSKDASSRGCPSCVSVEWGDGDSVDRRGAVALLERIAPPS